MMAKAKKTTSPALTQIVQAAVDEWYRVNMHGTVVSRDTDVHNLIHNAKPALVKAVVEAVGQTSTSE